MHGSTIMIQLKGNVMSARELWLSRGYTYFSRITVQITCHAHFAIVHNRADIYNHFIVFFIPLYCHC